jgi:antirestriction protein ArdC
VLWAEAEEHGYRSNSWLTYKQAAQLGGNVRKGEKSTTISFWKFDVKDVEDEKTGEVKRKQVMYLRMYGIFNLEQTDGVKLPKKIAAQQPDELPEDDGFDVVEAAQTVVDGYLNSDNAPGFKHHGVDRAYYNITQDYIRLPLRSAFREPSGYYATAFHEMGHSTGAASRLNRFDPESTGDMAPFGSATYSKEELVAELTSAYLSAETGIDNTLEDSAAYIAGWLRVLKNDSSMVSKAATKAQQAANLILSASTEAEGKE